MASTSPVVGLQEITDEALVQRVLGGDTALFEVLMRRHNRLLYRIARSILLNEAEAEDVMQEAYVRAYRNLAQFAGRARFVTWLSRIVLYESLNRARKQKRVVGLDAIPESEKEAMNSFRSAIPSPEVQASDAEVRRLLEQEVDALPDKYRTIFVLRSVEEISVDEVADLLEISPENVKTRLHRAHAILRKRLYDRTGSQSREAFSFHATRCDRVVKRVWAVLQRIRSQYTESAEPPGPGKSL